MTSGYPCPECGEHVRPFEGCLCPIGEPAVPYRTCPCCGRSWATEADMRDGTDPLGWTLDGDEEMEWVNCDCGSTLVIGLRQADRCPPTLRDPGLPPVVPGIRDAAAGDANSRE